MKGVFKVPPEPSRWPAMPRLAKNICRYLVAPCALLLIVALQHCLWESAMAARHLQAVAEIAASGDSLPIGMPKPGCDNESGCICRGATLAQPVLILARPTLEFSWFLSADDSAGRELCVAYFANGRFHDGLNGPPPLSGRMLRARLSSLVI